MKHHITLDDETMAVLRRCEITSSSVMLPPEILPRPLYEKVNKALNAAGGKWTGKLGKGGKHVFPTDPREALGLAVTSGTIKDTKKFNQAFYTPPEVARIVVQIASVEGKTVLEPSAGHGALATACRANGAEVTCIEEDRKSCDVLESLGLKTTHANFLGMDWLDHFDRVVMNPPFENGKDIAHVTHAFKFLADGGRLVAIMSPAWQTKQDKKSAAFRALVNEFGHIAEKLEPGAFKESGTNVATVIVILNRP